MSEHVAYDSHPLLNTGVELDELEWEGTGLLVREVGGGFARVWPNYFSDCQALVFVVDVADPCSISEAAYNLFAVTEHSSMVCFWRSGGFSLLSLCWVRL